MFCYRWLGLRKKHLKTVQPTANKTASYTSYIEITDSVHESENDNDNNNNEVDAVVAKIVYDVEDNVCGAVDVDVDVDIDVAGDDSNDNYQPFSQHQPEQTSGKRTND